MLRDGHAFCDSDEGAEGEGEGPRAAADGGREGTSAPVHSVLEPESTEPRFADVMEPE